MFNICQFNANTITGSNLRKIMLLCDKTSISQIEDTDILKLTYSPVPPNEEWRLTIVKDLLDARYDPEVLPGFNYDEIRDMLEFACVS